MPPLNINDLIASIEEEYLGSDSEEENEEEEFEELALEQETNLCSARTNSDSLINKEAQENFDEQMDIPDENEH